MAIKAVYVSVAKTKDMAKFIIDGKEEWCDVSKAVKGFLSSKHNEGDELYLAVSQGKYTDKLVVRVSDTEEGAEKEYTPKTDYKKKEYPQKQYKKPYSKTYQPKEAPEVDEPKETVTRQYGNKSFDNELSAKQTVLHSVSRALIALQGHLDVNILVDEGGLIDILFDKFMSKLK